MSVQLAEPWCSCLIDVMPDTADGLGQIRIVKPCWAHEFVGPPGLGSGFRPDSVREYKHGSPLSTAVTRAVGASERNRT